VVSELDGQVAIVTGAARNIGRRIAEVLADRGATVVSLDLLPSDETVAAIENRGGRAAGLEVDLTDEHAVETSVREIVRSHDRLDVLVNNAGLFAGLERRPFWEIDAEEWDRVMRANVHAVFLVTRAASAPMRDARRGRIVNLASNVITFGMANLLHYVASKAAVIGMTRAMARELGPYGIAVNAVGPGLVETELIVATMPAEYRESVVRGQCLQEPIRPDDVAEAVAFLAGPRGRLVTGQTLFVNAGASMGPA
jgi:3-oxoacyl-[acyl-carrier protein] reductase